MDMNEDKGHLFFFLAYERWAEQQKEEKKKDDHNVSASEMC